MVILYIVHELLWFFFCVTFPDFVSVSLSLLFFLRLNLPAPAGSTVIPDILAAIRPYDILFGIRFCRIPRWNILIGQKTF
jgi:hypothetical protein